ncbi:MAG: nuclear transport factor 2 family protein [Solimonas sp.]
MKKKTAFCCIALILLTACTGAPPKPVVVDHPDIRAVVESFRTAIIQRDKPRFMSLFLADTPITWQAVMEDGSLDRLRLTKPQAVKVRVKPDSTPQSFIDGIVHDDKLNEEVFENVRIDSDGDAAAVAFDYRYLYAGEETNHGREWWLLVRTDKGWKITSVVYSVTLPRRA